MGIDWFPTILELCDIENTSEKTVDGKSLLPVLAGNPSPHKVVNWQVNKRWAVYKEGYKLIGELANKKENIELYCLDNDMAETQDIAASHPDIVAELKAERQKWLKEINKR